MDMYWIEPCVTYYRPRQTLGYITMIMVINDYIRSTCQNEYHNFVYVEYEK